MRHGLRSEQTYAAFDVPDSRPADTEPICGKQPPTLESMIELFMDEEY